VRNASGLSYLLADHLGSTVGTIDAATGAVTTQKYWPYGATRSGGVTQTDKLYTGQQQEPGDAALGLYNYKARFYATSTGAFTSADSISGSRPASQSLNRYAYARSNPQVYVDPSGHCVIFFDKDLRNECSFATVKRFLHCGLEGDCQDLTKSGISFATAQFFSRWALQVTSAAYALALGTSGKNDRTSDATLIWVARQIVDQERRRMMQSTVGR